MSPWIYIPLILFALACCVTALALVKSMLHKKVYRTKFDAYTRAQKVFDDYTKEKDKKE